MKSALNKYMNTSFRNGNRKSGMGMLYDKYDDEEREWSGRDGGVKVRLPSDKVAPESLNGEVIIVQKGKKKDG